MGLHPAIVARSSPQGGLGLFVTARIAAGDVIWYRDTDEEPISLFVIRTWSPEQQQRFFAYAVQVSQDCYTGPRDGVVTDIADYMNHSCDPNTWFLDDQTMTAMRDIEAGQEIVYDYATSESAEHFVLPCRCGSDGCRGTVRGSDYRNIPALRERYGRHVLSHVLQSHAGLE
ncbi:MAG: SET domain-containing protein-lysine N-methyltransferase [Armatimonadetes bacterium]|nr:SET domain-containing protein-lysine N-methyltransferase [Armatimonadota bacterium]